MTPTTVWCVFENFNHSIHGLVAVCATQERAEEALKERMTWIDDYHGPHYAPQWSEPTLFDTLGNSLSVHNQYGETIWTESVLFLA